MVKQGPCRHCGVTSTPLWRNGPPEKPVLCNACGSRWRTKGNLTNYTPLRARAEPDEYEYYKFSSIPTGNVNKSKDVKVLKWKKNRNNDVDGLGGDVYDYSHGNRMLMDDETSNRSSSGSGVSNSESFGPFSSTVGSDLTGPDQSTVWDTTAPSQKRTCMTRSMPSPIEKFTQELYTIWQEQQSYGSQSPEEELFYESDRPLVSVEIGHGSVLIRHPSEIVPEEDSEASSISAEIKPYSRKEAHLHRATSFSRTKAKSAAFQSFGAEKSDILSSQSTMNPAQSYRNKAENVLDIQRLLGKHDSPLCVVDLNDIVNLEEFAAQFTTQEQRQLLKYLPKSDVESYPIRLQSLFNDPQFRESLLSFQQLLAEGVFDPSSPNVKSEACRNLRRLALSSPVKSNWAEQYNLLKKRKYFSREHNEPGSNPTKVAKLAQKSQESETEIFLKGSSTAKMAFSNQTKKFVETGCTGFLPISISSSIISHPIGYYNDGLKDQDLLIDVPSNYAFPQGELLHRNRCR